MTAERSKFEPELAKLVHRYKEGDAKEAEMHVKDLVLLLESQYPRRHWGVLSVHSQLRAAESRGGDIPRCRRASRIYLWRYAIIPMSLSFN